MTGSRAALLLVLVAGTVLLQGEPQPRTIRKCIAGHPLPWADCAYRWQPDPHIMPGVQTIGMIKFATGKLPPAETMLTWMAEAGNWQRWLIVFNECEEQVQCNASPEVAAQALRVIEGKYKASDIRLIVGGSIMWSGGYQWMVAMVESYRARYGEYPQPAGWHFHVYAGTNHPTPQSMYAAAVAQVENVRRFVARYGNDGQQVWLTEFGCLWAEVCTPDYVREYMRLMLSCLDTIGCGAFFDRVFWFTTETGKEWAHTSLLDGEGQPNGLAQVYEDWRPVGAVPLSPSRVFLPAVRSSSA